MNYIEALRAVVRPLVTLIFVGAYIYLSIIKVIPIEGFISLSGMIIGSWFQSRSQKNANSSQGSS